MLYLFLKRKRLSMRIYTKKLQGECYDSQVEIPINSKWQNCGGPINLDYNFIF